MVRVFMPQASSRRAGAQLAVARPSHTAMRRAALFFLLGSVVAAESSSGESDDCGLPDGDCAGFTWKAAVAGGTAGGIIFLVLLISFATRKSGGGGAVSPEEAVAIFLKANPSAPKLLHEMSAAALMKKTKEVEEDKVESMAPAAVPAAAGMEFLDVEEGAPAPAPEAAEEAKADE